MSRLLTLPSTGHRHSRLLRLGWVLFAATFVVQCAFPYVDGGTLGLTIASVVLLTASVLVHVAATVGPSAAAILAAVAGGGGLIAESVGVHTGVPFGDYDYTGTLGPELFGVPIVVPLAWIMMAWPALVAARRLTGTQRPWATVVVGACALTAWDVFLDPQMVDQGYWRWHHPEPSLPGVDGIPLTNFAGWFLVALVMMAVLDRLLGRPTDDALPITIYLWTYFSSVMAHAVFFGRPPVALVGGLIMGAIAVPLLVVVLRGGDRARI
ncbi:carotenoid biosynthesis protein [Gordonia sp. CPCC 205515]|uniref:carotenoid biosynthesis protein n=1 Tax=Gordonia sp. CPCC 205515 TaxID=3140791 RepID=UPI003AF3AB37